MRRIEDHYIVYVSDGYYRRYDKGTLPDEIKTKLAMILASPHTVMPDLSVTNLRVYQNDQSEELDEIGWRVSESYYCIVMSVDLLKKLRGENDG